MNSDGFGNMISLEKIGKIDMIFEKIKKKKSFTYKDTLKTDED